MKNQYLTNYCMDYPEHQMFKVTDGARCVECNGLVNVKEVTKSEHYRLPTYQQLRYELKQKQKPKQLLSISVDMDTNKLQLKLRAIAKHTAALADELDAIDNALECSNCGSYDTETLWKFGEEKPYKTICSNCHEHIHYGEEYLEGSD